MAKASPRRPVSERIKSTGRSDLTRGSRLLRAAVMISMVIAVVILLSLAFSGDSKRGEESSGVPDVSAKQEVPDVPDTDPVALLLRLDEEVPGILVTEIGAQSITDIAAGAADPAAERLRLEVIGFREAAIVLGIKPPEAGGLLAGSDLVIQIVGFKDANGARAQSERDETGALAADFGAVSPGVIKDSSLADGGFSFTANGPETPRGQPSIKGVALRQGAWTVSVVATSPPGTEPAPDELLNDLASRQAARLRGI